MKTPVLADAKKQSIPQMSKWRYIEEDNVPAAQGLATDEYLMNSYSLDEQSRSQATLRCYTYSNHNALVGRFQNINAELDLEYCRREKIQFSRRLTGGGAIIMGLDQLGICLASKHTFGAANTRELYFILSKPIIKALAELDIQANFAGKNDLEVDGKKIAGLGIHINPYGAIQFHASLLVDLDITEMLKVLKVPLQKIGDKAQIQKVEQRITTISRELNEKTDLSAVRDLIKQNYASAFRVKIDSKDLTPEDKKEIESLAKEKYQNEAWVFQNTPQADMNGMGIKKTRAGLLRTYVALKGETIKSVLITGDFLGHDHFFKHVETQLKWSPADKTKITEVVKKSSEQYDLNGEVTIDEVANAIWRASLGAMKEVRHTYQGSCYYPT